MTGVSRLTRLSGIRKSSVQHAPSGVRIFHCATELAIEMSRPRLLQLSQNRKFILQRRNINHYVLIKARSQTAALTDSNAAGQELREGTPLDNEHAAVAVRTAQFKVKGLSRKVHKSSSSVEAFWQEFDHIMTPAVLRVQAKVEDFNREVDESSSLVDVARDIFDLIVAIARGRSRFLMMLGEALHKSKTINNTIQGDLDEIQARCRSEYARLQVQLKIEAEQRWWRRRTLRQWKTVSSDLTFSMYDSQQAIENICEFYWTIAHTKIELCRMHIPKIEKSFRNLFEYRKVLRECPGVKEKLRLLLDTYGRALTDLRVILRSNNDRLQNWERRREDKLDGDTEIIQMSHELNSLLALTRYNLDQTPTKWTVFAIEYKFRKMRAGLLEFIYGFGQLRRHIMKTYAHRQDSMLRAKIQRIETEARYVFSISSYTTSDVIGQRGLVTRHTMAGLLRTDDLAALRVFGIMRMLEVVSHGSSFVVQNLWHYKRFLGENPELLYPPTNRKRIHMRGRIQDSRGHRKAQEIRWKLIRSISAFYESYSSIKGGILELEPIVQEASMELAAKGELDRYRENLRDYVERTLQECWAQYKVAHMGTIHSRYHRLIIELFPELERNASEQAEVPIRPTRRPPQLPRAMNKLSPTAVVNLIQNVDDVPELEAIVQPEAIAEPILVASAFPERLATGTSSDSVSELLITSLPAMDSSSAIAHTRNNSQQMSSLHDPEEDASEEDQISHDTPAPEVPNAHQLISSMTGMTVGADHEADTKIEEPVLPEIATSKDDSPKPIQSDVFISALTTRRRAAAMNRGAPLNQRARALGGLQRLKQLRSKAQTIAAESKACSGDDGARNKLHEAVMRADVWIAEWKATLPSGRTVKTPAVALQTYYFWHVLGWGIPQIESFGSRYKQWGLGGQDAADEILGAIAREKLPYDQVKMKELFAVPKNRGGNAGVAREYNQRY